MTNWTDYFDAIYVISLDQCKSPENHRMPETISILLNYNIKFKAWSGIKAEPPTLGICKALQSLLCSCISQYQKRVLIFEDDIQADKDPGEFMSAVIEQLKNLDWDMLSLGPNTHQPFEKRVSENILPLFNAYGLHAMAYSESGMKKILELKWDGTPIDKMIAEKIQPDGKCFCTYPLLFTQRNGYSDIEQKQTEHYYIKQKFYTHCEKIMVWSPAS